MIWDEHIHSDPAILVGKPLVRGTRLAVEFILELFAAGSTPAQVAESYPTQMEYTNRLRRSIGP